MKYQSITKTNRNLAIIQLHQANPDLSLRELGELFPNDGKPLTRQRVFSIVKLYNSKKKG